MFQRDARADAPSSGEERSVIGWMEKEIEWRPFGLHTYWKDGFHINSAEEKVKVKIGGSVMIDGGTINADRELRTAFPDLESQDVDFRRLRVNILSTFYDFLDFRLDIDFTNVREIKDDWIGLRKNIPILGYVKAGHMKEPFSLEELTSGTNITFMERALPTLAFAPGRHIGLMFNNTALNDRVTWALGGFLNTGSFSDLGDPQDQINNANGYNLGARVTGLPWYEDGGRQLLHLGLCYDHQTRNKDKSGGEVRFRARPESYLTNDRIVDTGDLVTDRADLINAELALVEGPLSLQGEYSRGWVNQERKPSFWGFYLYGSYFLTGEHRRYDSSTGIFSRISPKQNFHPFHGGWGAWEVGVRISYIDLNDKGIEGGKEGNLTLGLNWYLNPNVRVMFNYIRALVEDRDKPSINRGNANIIQARFQLAF